MEKKTIRLNEEDLRNIISRCINEAMSEDRFDYLDSGLRDYQGTGSEASKDRVDKIRAKRGKYGGNPEFRIPGNSFLRPGKDGKDTFKNNSSTTMDAKKRFGGENAKTAFGSFDELVKPLVDRKLNAYEANDKAWEALDDLYYAMYRVYVKWSQEHKGGDFKGGKEGEATK